MQIIPAENWHKEEWNKFVGENYPPIGAFMQTWEWGEFQKNLGREMERHLVQVNAETVAIFTMVKYTLPPGLIYWYAPRGPSIRKDWMTEDKISVLFQGIRQWANDHFAQTIFVRFEPPIPSIPEKLKAGGGFSFPKYYFQPRYNLAIPLEGTPDEIAHTFHPTTRTNLTRAEKRGASVQMKSEIREDEYKEFTGMMRDTIVRNSGKNTYPSDEYLHSLLKTFPPLSETDDRNSLSMEVFFGYQNEEPAAINLVVFFGGTATYLYGASRTKNLNAKIPTYLHWQAMLEAKRNGFKYYDLGGIDGVRWPALTNFKRQFHGKEFEYVGDIEIPLKPIVYPVYNFLRSFK